MADVLVSDFKAAILGILKVRNGTRETADVVSEVVLLLVDKIEALERTMVKARSPADEELFLRLDQAMSGEPVTDLLNSAAKNG